MSPDFLGREERSNSLIARHGDSRHATAQQPQSEAPLEAGQGGPLLHGADGSRHDRAQIEPECDESAEQPGRERPVPAVDVVEEYESRRREDRDPRQGQQHGSSGHGHDAGDTVPDAFTDADRSSLALAHDEEGGDIANLTTVKQIASLKREGVYFLKVEIPPPTESTDVSKTSSFPRPGR